MENTIEKKEPITINLNFIFNTITSTTEIKETIVEQILNLDHEQITLLTQQAQGENNG